MTAASMNQPGQPHKRLLGVIVLSVLIGIYGFFVTIGAIIILAVLPFPNVIPLPLSFGSQLFIGIISLVLWIILILIAIGLWNLRMWALLVTIVVLLIAFILQLVHFNGSALSYASVIIVGLLLLYTVLIRKHFH